MKTQQEIYDGASTPFLWKVIGYIFLTALAWNFFVPVGQAILSIFM